MTSWLLRQINASEDFAGHLDEVSPHFHHPWVLLALALLIPLAVFIYLRQLYNLPSVPTAIRAILTSTRVLILALLIVILAGPYLKLHLKSEKKPVVAFLLDHSQSMQLPAGPFESDSELIPIAGAAGYKNVSGQIDAEARKALNRISRAKLAQSVLQKQTGLLDALAKKYDLQYYSFGRDLTELGVNATRPDFPEPPNPGGNATQMGDAVAHLLDESAGRQIAGIVLFGDGQNTGGRSPIEAAQAARALNSPIFTVPVGTATRLKDIAIVDVFTTGLVSKGDTARVAVTIESQGFDKRQVKVILKDGDKQLDTKDLVLTSNEQQVVELTFKADQAGARYLTVHVPPEPEESEALRANNTDTAFLRVSEEKIKVLLIDGLPRWDFRFLKNALRRDNGVGGVLTKGGSEVDVRVETEWRRLPAEARKDALPRTLEKLSEYHTIILGDVSLAMLDSAWIDVLVKAVREKGVGLIVAAGTQAMPHRFDERLLDLLPVRLRKGAPGMLPRGIPSFHLELAPEGVIHESTRFFDDPGRNQNAWSQLPPYYWAAATEKPAPGATVLVWNTLPKPVGKLPLIAHHYAGKGKVMFVGTDATWRWRQNVGDRFFYKFWGQGVRSVARTDARDAKKSRLEVRPVRAQPGERADIELNAVNADGSPVTKPAVKVQIQGAGSANEEELTPDLVTKGLYRGKFTPAAAGEYRLSYTAEGQTELVEARLRVAAASEELRHPNVNRGALEQIAASSGGQLVELPDLESIPEQLKGESNQRELLREADLWDNWMTLTLLIGLYCVDVGIRRLLGLY